MLDIIYFDYQMNARSKCFTIDFQIDLSESRLRYEYSIDFAIDVSQKERYIWTVFGAQRLFFIIDNKQWSFTISLADISPINLNQNITLRKVLRCVTSHDAHILIPYVEQTNWYIRS